TVELGTIKARMGRGIRPLAAQNVAAFGAGIFVLGLICALLRIGRNAFRYAGITRAIVMLAARADRFLEISVGIRGRVATDRRLARASGSLKSNIETRQFYRTILFAAVHESAIGTKRTFKWSCAISAFGGKADIGLRMVQTNFTFGYSIGRRNLSYAALVEAKRSINIAYRVAAIRSSPSFTTFPSLR